MELTLELALAFFFAGGFLLTFIFFRIRHFDRMYYSGKGKE